MTLITRESALSPDEFLAAVARGALDIVPSFLALVDVDADDPTAIRLSLDRTCTGWFSVPRSLVASLAPQATEACGDHRHVLARVQLAEGHDAATRGLIRIIRMQAESFARLLQASTSRKGFSQACLDCTSHCHGSYDELIDCHGNCLASAACH